MPRTVTFTVEELRDLIAPALNVCWSLRLEVQDHPCRYQPAATKGAHGLSKLLYLAEERSKSDA